MPDSSWFLFYEWCSSLNLSWWDASQVLDIPVSQILQYQDRRLKTPDKIIKRCRELSLKANKIDRIEWAENSSKQDNKERTK